MRSIFAPTINCDVPPKLPNLTLIGFGVLNNFQPSAFVGIDDKKSLSVIGEVGGNVGIAGIVGVGVIAAERFFAATTSFSKL